jgi:hypothetical protein
MEMTVNELKSEINELGSRINTVGTYDVAATNLPEELEHLNTLNRAAENYKDWCEEVLMIRQDQHRKLSLEGIIVQDII